MKPMSEAPDEPVLVRALTFDCYDDYWSIRSRAKHDRATGFLPLPADASDTAIRECAVEWINSLPESEREQAKKEIR